MRGDDDEGRQRPPRHHDRGDSDAQDVAHAQKWSIHPGRNARLVGKCDRERGSDEVEALDHELEHHAHPNAPEHAPGLLAATLGSHQDLGTCHAFRVGELPMLLLDEVAA